MAMLREASAARARFSSTNPINARDRRTFEPAAWASWTLWLACRVSTALACRAPRRPARAFLKPARTPRDTTSAARACRMARCASAAVVARLRSSRAVSADARARRCRSASTCASLADISRAWAASSSTCTASSAPTI